MSVRNFQTGLGVLTLVTYKDLLEQEDVEGHDHIRPEKDLPLEIK